MKKNDLIKTMILLLVSPAFLLSWNSTSQAQRLKLGGSYFKPPGASYYRPPAASRGRVGMNVGNRGIGAVPGNFYRYGYYYRGYGYGYPGYYNYNSYWPGNYGYYSPQAVVPQFGYAPSQVPSGVIRSKPYRPDKLNKQRPSQQPVKESNRKDELRIDYVGNGNPDPAAENRAGSFLGGASQQGFLGGSSTAYNSLVTNAGQIWKVQSGFKDLGSLFGDAWDTSHPDAWKTDKIRSTGWWQKVDWGKIQRLVGCDPQPIRFDFGDDLTFRAGNVYQGKEISATSKDFFNQASEILTNGKRNLKPDSTFGQWLPLGVFAVVDKGQDRSNLMIQLAVNHKGLVRGNVIDSLLVQVRPIEGYLDKKSQRVVFQLKQGSPLIAEAGLFNLTEDVASIVFHKSATQQDIRGLVRLQNADK